MNTAVNVFGPYNKGDEEIVRKYPVLEVCGKRTGGAFNIIAIVVEPPATDHTAEADRLVAKQKALYKTSLVCGYDWPFKRTKCCLQYSRFYLASCGRFDGFSIER